MSVLYFVEKEVKTKINTLRSYFTNELKKVYSNKSGDGRENVYESKWPHFQSLMFLKDTVSARKNNFISCK